MLGKPDGQELPEQAEAYEVLTGGAEPLPIGEPQWEERDVHVLWLYRRWG